MVVFHNRLVIATFNTKDFITLYMLLGLFTIITYVWC